MKWHEQSIGFDCEGVQLTGIATLPERARSTGVVVIVGGPQYRVGSHRQFVLLARRLAAEGYPVLRFDYRGMGDSPGPLGHFEGVQQDVAAAIDALNAVAPGVERVVLWGLCDGASAALLYAHECQDTRVQGLVLLNPWVRTAASQARTRVRFYYLQRVMQPAFWAKLFGGRVAAGALRGFFGNLGSAVKASAPTDAGDVGYPAKMALGWQAFSGPRLLMLSELDYTAREFEAYCAGDNAWRRALKNRRAERVQLDQADHTCSSAAAEAAMHAATLGFLNQLGDHTPKPASAATTRH